MRIVIALIVFAVWCYGSTHWYLCKIKGLCSDDKQTNEVLADTNKNKQETEHMKAKGNLVFEWNSENPLTNAQTASTIDSLKNVVPQNGNLTITGLYRPDESNTSSFQNHGLARAEKVKDLLASNGLSNITTESREVTGVNQTSMFKGVEFDITGSDTGFEFVEYDNKIIINFPVASANPGLNTALNEELKKIAEHAIENKQSLLIVGHTDNRGTHEANIKYGQLRADAISKILLDDGVPASQITTKSEGEHLPLASNATTSGRKKNRRVEITIK